MSLPDLHEIEAELDDIEAELDAAEKRLSALSHQPSQFDLIAALPHIGHGAD